MTREQEAAIRRARMALDVLEFKVQAGLSEAAELLGVITGGISEDYDACRKLYAEVETAWHGLNDKIERAARLDGVTDQRKGWAIGLDTTGRAWAAKATKK